MNCGGRLHVNRAHISITYRQTLGVQMKKYWVDNLFLVDITAQVLKACYVSYIICLLCMDLRV